MIIDVERFMVSHQSLRRRLQILTFGW